MVFSRANKGQTEPLAALVAVSAFIVGIGIYGAYVADALPGTTDRTQEQTAIDRVWADLEEHGVFYAHDEPGGSNDVSENVDDISSDIETGSLPSGENVAVSVEVHIDGSRERLAEARFDAGGSDRSLDTVDDPPTDAGLAERVIPVTVEHQAAVRSGTLRVEVWS